ncbi:MAG: hypothetical protein LBH96_04850 [Candidatus Peribacteria bacterium]|nr:hypothetical protein [Candidatus Peribacteria bacterium]
MDFIPEDGIYTCEPYTYAISHSHNQLFFAVDEQNITVDVEKIIERDEALLYNLPLLNTAFSLWENFYFQWCAKECLVKYLNLRSTQMAQMQVKEI